MSNRHSIYYTDKKDEVHVYHIKWNNTYWIEINDINTQITKVEAEKFRDKEVNV